MDLTTWTCLVLFPFYQQKLLHINKKIKVGEKMQSYLIHKKEECLWFTINRPEKRNAINYEVMEGLEEFLTLGESQDIKALVITGSGNTAFCSGGDLSVFHQLKTEEEAYAMLSKMASILYKLLVFPKPTIAVMNGFAVGGGCELATACDFRFAKTGIKAGFIQGKLAITTGWGGGSMLLEKIGQYEALKMLLTANLFNTEELLELGYIHKSSDDLTDENTGNMLKEIVKLEPDVLSSYKRMLIARWKATNLEQRIDEEVKNCAVLWQSEAHHKQVDSFLNK
jgi:enoyl-CoA hydratase